MSLQRSLLQRIIQNRQSAKGFMVSSKLRSQYMVPQIRSFSEGGEPPRRQGRDEYDQKEREKVKKAPDMDEKDETSFQDKNLVSRVLLYSFVVFGSLLLVNKKMSELLQKRKDRINGVEPVLTEKDKINAIGGPWVLKDLNGNNFGSANLQGQYYLLYFGFSLCPDICPLSLMKMTKAIRKIKQSKEGQQYLKLKGVFVTVNPEMDTPPKLREFCEMFDSDLISLREVSNQSQNLLNMLRVFKVPAGLNEEERQVVKDYFDNKKTKKSRFEKLKFWKRGQEFDPLEGMMNDHSRVFYLMAADNRFLSFYPLDLDESELVSNVMEDISFDLGIKYLGTGNKPPVNQY